MNLSDHGVIALLIVFAIWELTWKGFALWKAGRAGQKWWFVAILFINTIGILPIAYLWFFSDKEKKQ